MTHDDFPDIPAALPAAVFALFLELTPRATSPSLVVAASVAIALLLTGLVDRARSRAIVLCLAASTGALVSVMASSHQLSLRQTVAALPSAQFLTVEAPLTDDWRNVDGTSQIRVERFRLELPAPVWIDAPLTIRLRGEPPDCDGRKSIEARGFLRTSERGELSLIVKSARLVRCEGEASLLDPRSWNRRLDERLRLAVRRDPSLEPSAELAAAFALGRTSELSEDVKEPYRRGGTYHLLVFSGMQIALLAALLVSATRRLNRPRLGDVALMLLSVIAVPFAGWERSVVRAASIIFLYALSRLLRRPTSIANLLFVFALVRLMVVPDDLHEASFQLTCAAVAGFTLFGKPLAARIPSAVRFAAYGVGVTAATAPLTLFWFRQWMPAGALSTLILAPLASTMFLASVAAVVAPAGDCMNVALHCVGSIDRICTAVNEAMGHTLSLRQFVPAPPAVVIAVAFFLVVLAASAKRPVVRRLAVLPLLVPLIWSLALLHHRRSVAFPEMDVLDIGQGDAILLRSGARSMLLDGGGHGLDPHFGRSVLMPLLIDRGVTSLDVVALSHPHPDHCGGLIPVLSDLDVLELWIAPRQLRDSRVAGPVASTSGTDRQFSNLCLGRLLEEAATNDVAVVPMATGRRQSVGAMRFDPLVPTIGFKRSLLNNSSVVFRMAIGRWRILLTGDAEAEAERWLLGRDIDLAADVLKVGHHGSRTSTTAPFLVSVHPRIAVISCGLHNPFGHPNAEVLEALRASGVQVHRTDREGTVRVIFRPERVVIERESDIPR